MMVSDCVTTALGGDGDYEYEAMHPASHSHTSSFTDGLSAAYGNALGSLTSSLAQLNPSGAIEADAQNSESWTSQLSSASRTPGEDRIAGSGREGGVNLRGAAATPLPLLLLPQPLRQRSQPLAPV